MFTASLAIMMRFPLDWGIVVREYFSGSNAIGPYLIARFIADAPMGYGPFLLITLIYWMTGACFYVYIFLCKDMCVSIYVYTCTQRACCC